MGSRVVIIGGGFAGLAAARDLAKAKAADGQPFQITLVDRRNHHLFQPLLYQVATAALSPAEIAVPIRSLFSEEPNVRVVLDEITEFQKLERGGIAVGRAAELGLVPGSPSRSGTRPG